MFLKVLSQYVTVSCLHAEEGSAAGGLTCENTRKSRRPDRLVGPPCKPRATALRSLHPLPDMSTLPDATANATPPEGTSSAWSLDDGPLEHPQGTYDRPFYKEPGEGRCVCLITQYDIEKNAVVQRTMSCKRLSCEVCGPKQRLRSWKIARYLFAQENGPIYVTYVEAHKVDHLRKYAARRDQPIKSVPISDSTNAVFSTCRFEGSRVTDAEEIRQVFVFQRIDRRQLTATGRWVLRADAPTRFKFLSHRVTRHAFENVAKRLGQKVRGTPEVLVFDDGPEHGPEWYKKELYAETQRLKRERLASMGFHRAAASVT